MSIYETMHGSADQNQIKSIQKRNEMENKTTQQQTDLLNSRINLNEFIGKRMANNGELRNFSNQNQNNVNDSF